MGDWEFRLPLSIPRFIDWDSGQGTCFARDFRRVSGARRAVSRSMYITQLAGDPGDDRQRGNQKVSSDSEAKRGMRERIPYL